MKTVSNKSTVRLILVGDARDSTVIFGPEAERIVKSTL